MEATAKLCEARLRGGPQDGGKVKWVTGLPEMVYCGHQPMEDGYAAWSDEPSNRFPCGYRWQEGTTTYQYEVWP